MKIEVHARCSDNDKLNHSGITSWDLPILPSVGHTIKPAVFKDLYLLGVDGKIDTFYAMTSNYIWSVESVSWNRGEAGEIIPVLSLYGKRPNEVSFKV